SRVLSHVTSFAKRCFTGVRDGGKHECGKDEAVPAPSARYSGLLAPRGAIKLMDISRSNNRRLKFKAHRFKHVELSKIVCRGDRPSGAAYAQGREPGRGEEGCEFAPCLRIPYLQEVVRGGREDPARVRRISAGRDIRAMPGNREQLLTALCVPHLEYSADHRKYSHSIRGKDKQRYRANMPAQSDNPRFG